MNDALRAAAAVDPEWARKEQRRTWLVKATVVGTLIALAVGAIAFVVGVHNSTEITHVEKTVEHSACQEDAAGAECQKTKAESAKAANLRVTCIPFFKAGYPCPKPGSTEAQRASRRQALRAQQGSNVPTASVSPSGGDASIPTTGHSPSSPHESGGGGSTKVGSPAGGVNKAPEKLLPPTKNGSGGDEPSSPPATPAPAPASTPSQQSSTSSTERVESTTIVEPPAEPAAPIRSAVGGVVEEVGSTITGTVESVTGTSCSLAKLLCAE